MPKGTAHVHAELERQLRQSEARRRVGLDVAGVGDWRYDPATGTIEGSDRTNAMHRIPPGRPIPLEEHDARIHPEDRAAVRAARAAALRRGGDGRYRVEFRFVFDDEVRWFESVGQALFDEAEDDGAAPPLVGAMIDITERKREVTELARARDELEVERSRLDAVLKNLPVGVWIAQPDGRIVDKNDAADDIWRGDAPLVENLSDYGRYTAFDAQTGEELAPEAYPVARALETARRIEPVELKIRRFDGTEGVVLVSAAPILDDEDTLLGAVGINMDITDRAAIEATLRASEERQAFLLRLSDALRPLADPEEIQYEASRVLGERLDADRVAYGETADEDDGYFDVRRVYQANDVPSSVGRLRYRDYGTYVPGAFRAGRTLVVSDVQAASEHTEKERAAYEAIGVRAYVGVPLVKEGTIVAFLGVSHRVPREWSREEVSLVEEVAERTWAALERARVEAALRESEQRFRAVADLVPDLLWEDDAAGKHVWANRRWTEFTGQSPQEAAGQGWAIVLHPDDREKVRRDYLAALDAAAPYRNEYRLRRADGVYRWHLVEAVPILDEHGEVAGWLGASTDIHQERTWRERLEELVEARTRSLAESEERYRALVLTSAHTVWSSDARGRVFEDSPTWRAYTGQSYAEFLGAGIRRAVHPEDRAAMAEAWRRSVESVTPYDMQLRLWHGPSGTWRWNHVRAVPLRDPEGRVKGWFGTNTDVHDRVEAQRKLREMARRLTMAEQEERRRISQVLHDDLQQLLYAVEMKLDLARRRLLRGDVDAAVPELDKGSTWIDRAVETTRRLTVDLSPQILRDEGLVDAIGWLRSQMRALHDLDVSIDAAHAWYIEDEDLRVLLFQVVRELLFNVHKHAGTSEAHVRLVEEKGYLVIHVQDDGKGFDASRLELTTGEQEGWGLVRVFERLSLLGGELVVRSEPGRGTHVEVHAPVEARR